MICRDNSWSFGLALELWQYQKIQGENFVIDAPKKRRKSLSPKLKTWPSKGHEQRHKSNRRQGCPCSERPLAKLQPAPFFVSHSAKLQLVLFWSLSEAAGNASTSTVLKAVGCWSFSAWSFSKCLSGICYVTKAKTRKNFTSNENRDQLHRHRITAQDWRKKIFLTKSFMIKLEQ